VVYAGDEGGTREGYAVLGGGSPLALGAAEQRGPGDKKKDQEEPSDEYHSPEQALLLFNDAERASGEEV
jgi:hypothetical protein